MWVISTCRDTASSSPITASSGEKQVNCEAVEVKQPQVVTPPPQQVVTPPPQADTPKDNTSTPKGTPIKSSGKTQVRSCVYLVCIQRVEGYFSSSSVVWCCIIVSVYANINFTMNVWLNLQLENLSKEDLIKYVKKQAQMMQKLKARNEGNWPNM